MFYTEIIYRIFYTMISFLSCIFVGFSFGDVFLSISLEPWYNEWQMDTIQYFNPNEVFYAYLKIAGIISICLIIPVIQMHVLIFQLNGLTSKEAVQFISYIILSSILLYSTLHLRINLELISTLMDLRHFDDDIAIIYVPNLCTYVNNWSIVRCTSIIMSHIPLIWIWSNLRFNHAHYGVNYMDKSRLGYKLIIKKCRFKFVRTFVVPVWVGTFFLIDDFIVQLFFVAIFRLIYIIFLYFFLTVKRYQRHDYIS